MAKAKQNILGSILRRLDPSTWKKGSGYPNADELGDLALLANSPGGSEAEFKGLAGEVAQILKSGDEDSIEKVTNALLELTSEEGLANATRRIEEIGPEKLPKDPRRVPLADVDPETGDLTGGVEPVSKEVPAVEAMIDQENKAKAAAQVRAPTGGLNPQTEADVDDAVKRANERVAAANARAKAAEDLAVEAENLTPAQRLKLQAGKRTEAKAAEQATRRFQANTINKLKSRGLSDLHTMAEEALAKGHVGPEYIDEISDALLSVEEATTPEARDEGLKKLAAYRRNLVSAAGQAGKAADTARRAKDTEGIVQGLGKTHFKKGSIESMIGSGKIDPESMVPSEAEMSRIPQGARGQYLKRLAERGDFEAMAPEQIGAKLAEAIKTGKMKNIESLLGTGEEVAALKKTEIGRQIFEAIKGPLAEVKGALKKDKALAGKTGLSKMLANAVYDLAGGAVNAQGKMGMPTAKALGKMGGIGALGLVGWELLSRAGSHMDSKGEMERLQLTTEASMKQVTKPEDVLLEYDAQRAAQAAQLRQAQGIDPKLLQMITKLGAPALTSNEVYIGPNRLAGAMQSAQGGNDEALMGLLAQLGAQ